MGIYMFAMGVIIIYLGTALLRFLTKSLITYYYLSRINLLDSWYTEESLDDILTPQLKTHRENFIFYRILQGGINRLDKKSIEDKKNDRINAPDAPDPSISLNTHPDLKDTSNTATLESSFLTNSLNPATQEIDMNDIIKEPENPNPNLRATDVREKRYTDPANNPFAAPLLKIYRDLKSIKYEIPYIPQIIELLLLIVSILLLSILYLTVGIASQIECMLRNLITKSQANLNEASPIEKSAYAVTAGIYTLFWVPFWILLLPFSLLGWVWNKTGVFGIFVLAILIAAISYMVHSKQDMILDYLAKPNYGIEINLPRDTAVDQIQR